MLHEAPKRPARCNRPLICASFAQPQNLADDLQLGVRGRRGELVGIPNCCCFRIVVGRVSA
eukprot:1724176-Pyramimonas_sp.AAC.1